MEKCAERKCPHAYRVDVLETSGFAQLKSTIHFFRRQSNPCGAQTAASLKCLFEYGKSKFPYILNTWVTPVSRLITLITSKWTHLVPEMLSHAAALFGYKKGPYTGSKLKTGQIFFLQIFFCLSGKNNREWLKNVPASELKHLLLSTKSILKIC